MIVADVQRLLVGYAHVVDFSHIYRVIALTSVTFEKLSKLLVNVFQCLVLFDPLMQFSLNLLSIQKSPLINLLVFLIIIVVINHSPSLLHFQIILKIVVHEIIDVPFLDCLPLEHLGLGFSSGQIVLLNVFVIDSLVFVIV